MSGEGAEIYDITIFGGGLVGLYASYYAGFRGLKTKIVDTVARLGGTAAAALEKVWTDVAGYPVTRGHELVGNLIQQASQYTPTLCLSESPRALRVAGERLLSVETDRGEHLTHVLLITEPLPESLPLSQWGLETENGKLRVTTKMETSVAGIYAAGDVVTYPGRVSAAAVGFSEAALAINNAAHYIDPAVGVFPGHSSTMGPQGGEAA